MGLDYETKNEVEVIQTDVLVVGSGPIGATYARKLIDAGHKVLMVEAGSQDSPVAGEHKKNGSDQTIDEFSGTIKADLTSIADNETSSLPGASVTRKVGGMGTHWTCATPEPHPVIERPTHFSNGEWTRLFNEARDLIGTTSTTFETSTRHQLVKNLLWNTYGSERVITSTPLAVKKENGQLVWSSAATVLGDTTSNKNFTLLPEHICQKLNKTGSEVTSAEILDLNTKTVKIIKAKQYAICGGAVLTPQILWNSGMKKDLPALGNYLTERFLSFCQVEMRGHPELREGDLEPQVMDAVTEEKPWQTLIHRDAFHYGKTPEGVNPKRVVDLRSFGSMQPRRENRVEFMNETDEFGMPKPIFSVLPTMSDRKQSIKMVTDMSRMAKCLGSLITSPQMMPAGTALHISGTTRAGISVEDSVVDRNSKVWGVDNLYLGGCNVIDTQMACNPTLTAMCFAIVGAEAVNSNLSS